jgi:hypothetical protein
MYSRARGGQSFLELAPVQLPPPLAKHVLSGKYASAKDPIASLAETTRNLQVRKERLAQFELTKHLADAKRRGDHDLARQLTQQSVAQRTGNRELLAEQQHPGSRTDQRGPSDPETSNRKQVE